MADEDIQPSESVWVVHPSNPEAPQLISDTALDRFLAEGWTEMTDRARVRDAAQVAMFGPPKEPKGAKASGSSSSATKTGASGAGEG